MLSRHELTMQGNGTCTMDGLLTSSGAAPSNEHARMSDGAHHAAGVSSACETSTQELVMKQRRLTCERDQLLLHYGTSDPIIVQLDHEILRCSDGLQAAARHAQ